MSKHLNIVADANIWGIDAALACLQGYSVDCQILDNRTITHDALTHTDILLTRSYTKVNKALLDGTPVRFAATATIGDDHYDIPWLEANGIRWANAAGSSTGSVIEYIITTLLELHHRQLINLPDTCIGIIGAGRIGGALATICNNLGMQVIVNDPPRARVEGDAGFSSLEDTLAKADLITLHTPLIREGKDCTVHLLDQKILNQFKGKGIINAGRGICLDNKALLNWLDASPDYFTVLDCWENEPSPAQALIGHKQTAIATPHIAGHSLDGKAANTLYAYNALCHFLDIEPQWDINVQLPAAPGPVTINCSNDPWHNLYLAAARLYPIAHEHQSMISWATMDAEALALAFTHYRRHYPVRRAWQYSPVHFSNPDSATLKLADAAGFKLV